MQNSVSDSERHGSGTSEGCNSTKSITPHVICWILRIWMKNGGEKALVIGKETDAPNKVRTVQGQVNRLACARVPDINEATAAGGDDMSELH